MKRRIRQMVLLFMIIIVFIPINATATSRSGTCGDNLTWELKEDGTFVVSGTGPMYDYKFDYEYEYIPMVPWVAFRSQIKKVVIDEGVTSIGSYSFYECPNLTEVIIGNDVERIEEMAFSHNNYVEKLTVGTGLKYVSSAGYGVWNGWVHLKEIHISDLSAWYTIEGEMPCGWEDYGGTCLYLNGDKITEITVPDNVTSIRDGAFEGYSGITKITIPDSVNSIGNFAFALCPDLKEVYYEGNVEQWIKINRNGPAFNGFPYTGKDVNINLYIDKTLVTDLVVPDSVTEIGDYAFSNCSTLSSVYIPQSVKTIGKEVFANCDKLNNVEMSDGVETIGAFAFCQSSLLESIVLPDSVTVVGEWAFEDCKNLKSCTFSRNLENISERMFSDCVSLKNITLPEKIMTIGASAFEGCTSLETVETKGNLKTLENSCFSGCISLSKVTLSDQVTDVKEYAFYNCTELSEVVFSEQLQHIGDRAFENCSSLPEVVFHANVETIGKYAFENCSSIKQAVLSEKLNSIGDHGFGRCLTLDTIIFQGDAPSMSAYTFLYVKATCYYPKDNPTYTPEVTALDYGGDLIWTYEGESISNKCGDNLTWTITEDGTLSISGTGAMYDYSINELNYAPWYEIRNSIKSIQISDGVTYIGEAAFYGSRKATNVSIPDSVTSIGARAFAESSIENVKLPDCLTHIPDQLFEKCSYLHEVSFPKTLKTIGDSAFSCCYELYSLTLPEGVVSIGERAFALCGAWKTYGLYYDANNFDSIALPSTLKTIGKKAFDHCESLKNIVIPDEVTDIGEYTFFRCVDLEQATLPAKIERMENNVFFQCSSLKDIIFKWNVPIFAEKTFSAAKTTCYYPGNNPEWTEDHLQNYGGQIIWVAKDMEKPSEGTGGGSGGDPGKDEGEDSGESGGTEGGDSEQGGSGESGSGGSGSGSGGNDGNETGGDNSEMQVTVDNKAASVGAVLTEPKGGWKQGTCTFNVTCDLPCVVVISKDKGVSYSRLTANKGTQGYDFTVDSVTSDTIITILLAGDMNGDSCITNADTTMLQSAYLKKLILNSIQECVGDINQDNNITNVDITMLKSAILEKSKLSW